MGEDEQARARRPQGARATRAWASVARAGGSTGTCTPQSPCLLQGASATKWIQSGLPGGEERR
eukprot:3622240-Alexandrium_andersonii.AAC.1